jgi:hypothetical protein
MDNKGVIRRDDKIHLAYIILILILLVIIGLIQLGQVETTEYLVTVTAEGGAFMGQVNLDGCFELSLMDADHVVWFSDRPEREAWSTHISALTDVWEEEFAEVPPNAVLELFDDDRAGVAFVVELESAPVWDEDTQRVTFDKVCLLPSEIDSEIVSEIIVSEGVLLFSEGVLFIDSISVVDEKRGGVS